MNGLWTALAAGLLALAMAFSFGGYLVAPDDVFISYEQENISINPLTIENIEKTDDGYAIRDNWSGEVYFFDAETILSPESEGDIPGYIAGEAPLEWLERYLNEPIDSGLGFGMGDLFDAVVTGDHIDALLGVYWWD